MPLGKTKCNLCTKKKDIKDACCCNVKMHIYVDVMITVLSHDLLGRYNKREIICVSMCHNYNFTSKILSKSSFDDYRLILSVKDLLKLLTSFQSVSCVDMDVYPVCCLPCKTCFGH